MHTRDLLFCLRLLLRNCRRNRRLSVSRVSMEQDWTSPKDEPEPAELVWSRETDVDTYVRAEQRRQSVAAKIRPYEKDPPLYALCCRRATATANCRSPLNTHPTSLAVLPPLHFCSRCRLYR